MNEYDIRPRRIPDVTTPRSPGKPLDLLLRLCPGSVDSRLVACTHGVERGFWPERGVSATLETTCSTSSSPPRPSASLILWHFCLSRSFQMKRLSATAPFVEPTSPNPASHATHIALISARSASSLHTLGSPRIPSLRPRITPQRPSLSRRGRRRGRTYRLERVDTDDEERRR